jgi:hypothetical protein
MTVSPVGFNIIYDQVIIPWSFLLSSSNMISIALFEGCCCGDFCGEFDMGITVNPGK